MSIYTGDHGSTLWNIPHTRGDGPFPHPPFMWDQERRFLLRCELDGLCAHLYGLTREELAYIMDMSPIVKRKDEAKWGEYRTKRVFLDLYDEMT